MARKKRGEPVSGWINLDKPAGLTSIQAIGRIRRVFNPQKIGHAGTLDPLATGILPIAMGEATKTIPFIQDALKTYSFTAAWGEQRDTDDAEGLVERDVHAARDRDLLADQALRRGRIVFEHIAHVPRLPARLGDGVARVAGFEHGEVLDV